MSYDFFVSYSRALYRNDARDVTEILGRRGFRAWLDEQQLPPDLAGEVLARSLAEAVRSSRYLIFFDLQSWLKKIAMGVLADGADIVPLPLNQRTSNSTLWQKFERQFASKIIDIYPPMRTISFGGPADNRELPNEYPEIQYKDNTDAVNKILSVLGLN